MIDNENRNDERGSIEWLSINDLKIGMKGVNVKGKIDRIMPPQPTRYGPIVVAVISDSTSKINLGLFNGQSEKLNEGDEVCVEKGYTKEYNNVTTLYVKDGKL